jgi:uncharacterized membrane protein YhaH (DUF805 family)
MLGFLFGFNARLRRLQFFLATIAVAILMTAICFAIFSYAFQHWPRGTVPNLALAMTLWPVLAAAVLFGWLTFTLYAMRIRDIGWDPVCVIPGWIAVMIIDYLIATKVPAMSLGPEHHGTAVGGLVNLALTLAVLFWPSGHYEAQAPASGGSFRMPENALRGRETASATASRIARVANGEFGRR